MAKYKNYCFLRMILWATDLVTDYLKDHCINMNLSNLLHVKNCLFFLFLKNIFQNQRSEIYMTKYKNSFN